MVLFSLKNNGYYITVTMIPCSTSMIAFYKRITMIMKYNPYEIQ